MIVLFQGGPIHGEFSNFQLEKKEIRIQAIDDFIAVYHVGEEKSKEAGFTLAVAQYGGQIDSAASLIDLTEASFRE